MQRQPVIKKKRHHPRSVPGLFRRAALCMLVLAGMGPVRAEEMQIAGPSGPLAGEAVQVEGARHAVLIIPGSGPIDRDGNAAQMGLASNMYRQLAEGLAGAGIASLRVDKRGFFGSAQAISDPNQVSLPDYAADMRKWVQKARALAPCIWLAGHSEGGLVALLAAIQAPDDICGLILMAVPGRPVGQLLVEQLQANPATTAFAPQVREIVRDLETGKRRADETIPEPLRPIFPQGVQSFMIDLFGHDPSALARQWKGPVLILQGDHDMQVKPADAALLGQAMPQARRQMLPGATHMLKADVPGQPFATYTDPALPLDAAVVPAFSTFLDAHPPGGGTGGQ